MAFDDEVIKLYAAGHDELEGDEEDLDAVVASRPAGLVVPKPDSPDALRALDRDIVKLGAKNVGDGGDRLMDRPAQRSQRRRQPARHRGSRRR